VNTLLKSFIFCALTGLLSCVYGGTLHVANGATLEVDGELTATAVNGASGSTITGSGTVSAPTTTSGDVTPSAGNQLTFTSLDLNQSGSITLVVDSVAALDPILTVNGTLDVEAGTLALSSNAALTEPGYLLINFTTLTGPFGTINNTSGGGYTYLETGTTIQLSTDSVAPTLDSFSRTDGTGPSNGTEFQFGLTFSEAVAGLEAGDFSISFPGTTDPVQLSGSGTTYTLTVPGVSGSGDLTVSIADTGTPITDLALNALVSGGPSPAAIVVDQDAPVITVNSGTPLPLLLGEAFVDPGATAVDNRDGSVGVSTQSVGPAPDPNTPGTYVIEYEASDALGNVATVQREVVYLGLTIDTPIGGDGYVNIAEADAGIVITGTHDFDIGARVDVALEDSLGATVEAQAVLADDGTWSLQLAGTSTAPTSFDFSGPNQERDPQLAQLVDGSFVMTWYVESTVPGDTEIFFQRFGVDGGPVGSAQQVNADNSVADARQQIAALTDGGWVIVWHTEGSQGDGTDFEVMFQRYDAQGNPVGNNTMVNLSDSVDDTSPTILGLPDGGWMIAWEGFPGTNGGDREIVGRRYDSAGVPTGVPTKLDDPDVGVDALPKLALLNDGGWILAWQGFPASGTWDVFHKRFDADGVALSSDVSVNELVGNVTQEVGPNVAALADGGWVVSWREGSVNTFFFQQFDSNGQLVTSGTLNEVVASNTEYALVGLPGGGFICLFTFLDNGDREIYGRRFDAAGAAIGSSATIHPARSGTDIRPSGIPLQSGGYAAVWESVQNLTGLTFDGTGNATTSPFDGTSLADGLVTVTATALPDAPQPLVVTASYQLDTIAPELSTFVLNASETNPTGDNDVSVDATFSEEVTGLEANDFGVQQTQGTFGFLSLESANQIDFILTVQNITADGDVTVSAPGAPAAITDLAGNEWVVSSLQVMVTITNLNLDPTALILTNTGLTDGSPVGTSVGFFLTEDPDQTSGFSYALETGPGGSDNGMFTIVGNELKTAQAIDFNVKSKFSILVRVDDGLNGSFTRTFTLSAADNDGVDPLFEFATNMDPTRDDRSPVTVIDASTFTPGLPRIDGSDIQLVQRLSGVTYIFQFNDDLNTPWEDAPPSFPSSFQTVSTQGDYQVIQFPLIFTLQSGNPATFFRVSVELAP